ncbi:NAD(P)-binding protein [Rhizodiscina lignyota]|uniref:NAD(P)-binding protein n=1 Tax=Rhizodiscina lignyota TaxID=1504668 RepID=A0A9P4I5U9_9PEZI|nr:NAD(P)-binding protein [Rhizodiscina lignyota]
MFGFFEPTFHPDTDIPDLAGKVFLVTGGNAGLGKETVLRLAKHNPRNIFLAARDKMKADEAIRDIKKDAPNATITHLSLDLASLKSVRAAAETVISTTDRLDELINNAGVMAVPAAVTQEGYEIQFGTNHIGHFLLTKLLLPLLQRTAALPDSDVRIVNLSSGGHMHPPWSGILFDGSLEGTMEAYNTFVRYGQSKLANILHVRELAKRYPTIKAIAVHPGGVNTNLSVTFQKNHPWVGIPGAYLQSFVLKTAEQGALTQLWAATSPDAVSGKYYVPVARENSGSAYSRNPEMAAKLWDWTEEQLAKHGY